jgi:hypothetical protein
LDIRVFDLIDCSQTSSVLNYPYFLSRVFPFYDPCHTHLRGRATPSVPQAARARLRLVDFSLSQTTLEQVFIAFAKTQVDDGTN